jgi:RNA polymerase sigma factor (sigma-70 family)
MSLSRDENAKKSPAEAAQALILAYQNGDMQAFDKLLDECRYWEYIFKSLRAKGVPATYAEDFTQDICIRLMRVLKKFRFECTFEYYLNVIIQNQACNYYRKRDKRINGYRLQLLSLETLLAPAGDEKPPFDIPDITAPPPDAGLWLEEMRQIIAACLSLFKNKMTKLVICLALKGLRQRHITALLEIPFGTVGGYLDRGKKRLRYCIMKNYQESPIAV